MGRSRVAQGGHRLAARPLLRDHLSPASPVHHHEIVRHAMADTDIICISPIDGKELVRRPIMSEAAIDAAITSAREAQVAWRNTTIAERASKVSAFLDALLAMNQE